MSGYKDVKVRICTQCNIKNTGFKKTMAEAKKNLVMSALTIKNPPPKVQSKKWINIIVKLNQFKIKVKKNKTK